MVRLLALVTDDLLDWQMNIAAKNPGYLFSGLRPILLNVELLSHLKGKVTLEPTLSLSKATGIPPHVKQLNLISSKATSIGLVVVIITTLVAEGRRFESQGAISRLYSVSSLVL